MNPPLKYLHYFTLDYKSADKLLFCLSSSTTPCDWFALPSPHIGSSSLLHPSLQQPSLGMRVVSETVDGGAAELHRPVPKIQSTERGGWRKKTNWVGRSLFLARRKNQETLQPVRFLNITFHHSCKSNTIQYCSKWEFCVYFCSTAVGYICVCRVFYGWEKDDTDITAALPWRDREQWMKSVFGNVFRAEPCAGGTGGAVDQSALAMRDALTFHMLAHLDKK